MAQKNEEELRVYLVDSIGEQRGMHYYNFSLAEALQSIENCSVVLISTEETNKNALKPENIHTRVGFKKIYGKNSKWLRGLMYFFSIIRIGWWCKKNKPDIVHFHFFQIPLIDLFLVEWLNILGIKTVITIHDVLPFRIKPGQKTRNSNIYAQIYSRSSGLILHSEFARKSLSQLDETLLQKSIVIPHGNFREISSKLKETTNDEQISIQEGVLPLLVFGTIKPNKRLDLVLNALPQIIKKFPEVKLFIVGKPQDRNVDQDIELAKQLNLSSHVHWRLERVSDAELAEYIQSAALIIFPYQWIYQSGALLMAMSFGKPVIATAVGSNSSIVKDQITGILISPDDPAELALAVEKLLCHPEFSAQLGKAGKEFVDSDLSWDNIAQSTYRYYQDIVSLKNLN